MPSNAFTLVPAKENEILFTKTQKLFWHELFGENVTSTLLQRTDFDPNEFVEFLPNIWMADLLIGDGNILDDIKTTLFGTRLAEFYGERTSQTLTETNNKHSLKNEMQSTHQRTLAAVREMYLKNTPMYSHVEYLEEDKKHVTATGLLFPMCKNSVTTNMVLGYVEVSYRDDL